jgi:hypothetical protein
MNRLKRRTVVVAAVVWCIGLVSCSSNPTTSITTTSLPNGIVNQQYSQQLAGNSVSSWSLASGTLPAGLGLSATGLISGIPITAGTFSFTVQATSTSSTSTTAPTVSQALAITITAS